MNSAELTVCIIDFLEVAIHQILFVRDVYPSEIFEKRRMYNVAVLMSRHPTLNEYIRNVLTTIKPELQKGQINKVLLILHAPPDATPVETFIFNIQPLASDLGGMMDNKTDFSVIPLADIETHLRGFLLKISVCDSILQPNKPDTEFSILMECAQQPDSISTWIPAEPSTRKASKESTVIPMKTMDAGPLKMQLYVEENRAAKSTTHSQSRTDLEANSGSVEDSAELLPSHANKVDSPRALRENDS
ncbi:MAD2 mitotic arrest deficient-like 2 [Thoreauomyces humboldtii]|nr:MAD2 mitotic arrest deficient-like 2 [Thoreauomyces humboldtii]